jgi:hypothetical protein
MGIHRSGLVGRRAGGLGGGRIQTLSYEATCIGSFQKILFSYMLYMLLVLKMKKKKKKKKKKRILYAFIQRHAFTCN